jgi:hypothetical protein
MNKKIVFICLIAAMMSLTSCITVYVHNTDTARKNPISAIKAMPLEQMKPQSANTNGFVYYKTFSALNAGWYKIATIKNNQDLGKHACAFKIYSIDEPQNGVYYASYFFDLRRGYGKTERYGHFFCMDWNKDDISDFSPYDFCLTYDEHANEGVTTTIWKKSSGNIDVWAFGVEFVEEDVTFTIAENNYYGEKESVPTKPSVVNGHDFVIEVEDKSKK